MIVGSLFSFLPASTIEAGTHYDTSEAAQNAAVTLVGTSNQEVYILSLISKTELVQLVGVEMYPEI